MGGVQLARARWANEPWFYRDRVFVGDALDVGGADDPLWRANELQKLCSGGELASGRLQSIVLLDHAQEKDVTFAAPPGGQYVFVKDDAVNAALFQNAPPAFDVVFASHVLEHMPDPYVALQTWWGALKVGGHLVVIVPDWTLYEHQLWPSRWNGDHRTSWRLGSGAIFWHQSDILKAIEGACPGAKILRAQLLDRGWTPDVRDQTSLGIECAIEVVARKENPS